jgi:hypothetical protein
MKDSRPEPHNSPHPRRRRRLGHPRPPEPPTIRPCIPLPFKQPPALNPNLQTASPPKHRDPRHSLQNHRRFESAQKTNLPPSIVSTSPTPHHPHFTLRRPNKMGHTLARALRHGYAPSNTQPAFPEPRPSHNSPNAPQRPHCAFPPTPKSPSFPRRPRCPRHRFPASHTHLPPRNRRHAVYSRIRRLATRRPPPVAPIRGFGLERHL